MSGAAQQAPYKIAVIEPLLGNSSGHYLRAVEGLSQLVSPAPVQAFVHKLNVAETIQPHLQLIQYFATTFFSKLPPPLKKDGLHFDSYIETILDGLGRRDHLVIPSVDIDLLASLLRCLSARSPRSVPAIHLRFIAIDAPPWAPEREMAAVVHALLALPGLEDRIHLLTELPQQQRWLREQWGVEAGLFPFFPAIGLVAAPRAAIPDQIRIGFFGNGRPEKGLDRVPALIETFARLAPDLADRVTWVAQVSGFYTEASAQPLTDFAKAHPGRLELHLDDFRGLDNAAYDALFDSVDILALPYQSETYRLKGSGVAAEAVYAGKPMVYTQGCAFGDLGGEAAIGAKLYEPFAQALIAICRDRAGYAAKAARACDALLAAVNSSDLVRRLRAPADLEG